MQPLDRLGERVLVDPFVPEDPLDLGNGALVRGKRAKCDAYRIRLVRPGIRDGSGSLLLR